MSGAAMDQGGGSHAVLELFETAQVVAMTLDVDGRITYCNGYLAELTGFTREELIGRDFFATFEPERGPDAMRDLIARMLAGDRETYGETVLVCDGTQRVIAWSDTIVRDEHGTIVGTTSIGQDVTDRRRAQTRLALQVEVAHVLASATTLEEAAHEVLAAARAGRQRLRRRPLARGRRPPAHRRHLRAARRPRRGRHPGELAPTAARCAPAATASRGTPGPRSCWCARTIAPSWPSRRCPRTARCSRCWSS